MNLLIFILSVGLSSCAFPGRQLTNRIEEIQSNIAEIKQLIFSEFPSTTYHHPVSRVKNAKLRSFLDELQVSEITITYIQDQLPDLLNSRTDFDSTITFSWIKRVDRGMQEQINIKSVYYFFSGQLPNPKPINTQSYKLQKYNDSIWVHSRIDDIVIPF